MAPLVFKFLQPIIEPIIEFNLLTFYNKLEELEKRVNNLEVPLLTLEEQIKDLTIATKGIYELVNSLICIASKH